MHHNVHCSTIYNNQDMEAAQMSIKRGMDKEDLVYTHTHTHTHTHTYILTFHYIYAYAYAATTKKQTILSAAT